ncbi:neutral ceramidase [Catalinimonas alkaloidigena]|uniref:neutral/alkaline non-lysosomal ceramidase N-terminal domain-containing protein n=1 Tax=Catalinimonas alkaloidigena TaxID=1075417 RepID=UPI002406950E|nr:neutral/alkaline non-lysosomal ceramidase N-terminal domain-containing protein [Catalinimonas alkaloidigena]MDF9798947.1 neutral ceramidase [Catalinimonas alkaloidigena]
MNTHTLKAGTAKIDITPPLGTIINGDHIMHYARYIHDPLFAKAMVLHNGKSTIAIMVVDICAMDQHFLDQVKQEIQDKTSIPATHILISSTHTHAAGSIMSLLMSPADLPYRQQLLPLLVEAVVQAHKHLQNARIAFGAVDIPEHLTCRRYQMQESYTPQNPLNDQPDLVKTNPFGLEHLIVKPTTQTDPQLSYLAVQSHEGKWLGLLANYSLHYVGDWENGTITADYFGRFAHYLQAEISADNSFVGIMSNGTSGEVNIWDFQNSDRYPHEHFAKSELIGSQIAKKVAQSLQHISWQYEAELSALYSKVQVKRRKPDEEELASARSLIGPADLENVIADENGLKTIYAREQILLNELPDTHDFPLQALRIGDGIIGALGGEFFSETGLKLKKEAGIEHYFTITLANDYVGYVPPAHELEKGGYECWRCRTSCLAHETENLLSEQLLQLIHTLK